MCETIELPWPPCDSSPFGSVSNKKCIIIKAKSEYNVEMKHLVTKFDENYKRALALFYAQEAEEKARKQNKLLAEYIAQLQIHLQSLKSGTVTGKRPIAPPEIYSEDPLDSIEECYSGIVTIGSISIQSESSVDMEFVEKKGLISLDTIEILKKCSSGESLSAVTSSKSREKRVRNKLRSSETKTKSSKCLVTRNSDTVVDARSISCAEVQPNRILEMSKSNSIERVPAEGFKVDVEEKCSKKIHLTSSENEVNLDSEDNYSDWSISDYYTAGEKSSKKLPTPESSRIEDAEQDVVSVKPASENHSVSSFSTNITQYTDEDAIIESLTNQVRELDKKICMKNDELKATLDNKLPVPAPKSPEEMQTLLAEEQNLMKQICFMRTKLNQLDMAASEPTQLKDFCENLLSAMSPKAAEKLILGKTDVVTKHANGQLTDQEAIAAHPDEESNPTNQLVPVQMDVTSNLNETQISPGQPNSETNNFTQNPQVAKPVQVSTIQDLLAQILKRPYESKQNMATNGFLNSNPLLLPQTSMSATYEKIIGKLLHRKENSDDKNCTGGIK